jgi:hypothetical protein
MRFPSSTFALLGFGLVSSAAFFSGGGCATGLRSTSEGAGGGGGEGGSSSVTGTGGEMTGPCVSADDCASFSDACNVGTCINGKCTKTPNNEGVACDDGKSCTQSDTCQNGMCTGPLKYCPSMDSCHVGTCDVETDGCVQVPGNDGAFCVDDDPCTSTGICSDGACMPGQPTDCSFLNDICNIGVCDSQSGCKQQPVADGTACKDGFFCTANDHCEAGKCVSEPNICAAPGDVCKTGSCNEATDACSVVNANNGGACDDMNACTTGTTCSSGLCGGGSPANQGGACDDKDACTTVDTCDANGACVGTSPIVQCMSGDGCCPQGCSLADDVDCVPACCGDTENDFPTGDNCFQGAAWIAWKYVPTCGFNVTRIELHSDMGNVALLADSNGFPGATLFQGQLSQPDPEGWIGANVMPPLALTGGQTYWIAENVSLCSIAQQGLGTAQQYYGSFNTLAGPWEGPYMGEAWTARIIGECP